MNRTALLLALLALSILGGCKDMPGADGRYATHDHGNDNRRHAEDMP